LITRPATPLLSAWLHYRDKTLKGPPIFQLGPKACSGYSNVGDNCPSPIIDVVMRRDCIPTASCATMRQIVAIGCASIRISRHCEPLLDTRDRELRYVGVKPKCQDPIPNCCSKLAWPIVSKPTGTIMPIDHFISQWAVRRRVHRMNGPVMTPCAVGLKIEIKNEIDHGQPALDGTMRANFVDVIHANAGLGRLPSEESGSGTFGALGQCDAGADTYVASSLSVAS